MASETIASPTERYEKRIAFFSEQAKTPLTLDHDDTQTYD
jgi:hypothetical protein